MMDEAMKLYVHARGNLFDLYMALEIPDIVLEERVMGGSHQPGPR